MTKKVLMITNLHWRSSLQVGDHELARQFLKAGWEVGFVSDPVTPFHFLKGVELRSRLKNYLAGGVREEDGRLWWYVPGSVVMPYNISFLKKPWVHEHWQKLTFPDVSRKVTEAGFGKIDVLYFRTPKQLYWLDAIDYDISIFRIADNDCGFFDYNDEVKKRQQTLIQKADLTVYTSKTLQSHVMGYAPKNALYLPNGVDFYHFSKPTSKPPEYEALSGPVAVHVGSVLPERFDFELVDLLTERFPDVHFVFIGPDSMLRKRIHIRPNVHLLGPRTLDKVPEYMQHADAGLILLDPMKNPALVNSTNPIKLYQYLASGLPVVSREWETLIDLSPPISMAESREEYCQILNEILSEKCSDENIGKMYAGQFDWKSQFDFLLNEIESISHKKKFEVGHSSSNAGLLKGNGNE